MMAKKSTAPVVAPAVVYCTRGDLVGFVGPTSVMLITGPVYQDHIDKAALDVSDALGGSTVDPTDAVLVRACKAANVAGAVAYKQSGELSQEAQDLLSVVAGHAISDLENPGV
jgi:hypothetical protein